MEKVTRAHLAGYMPIPTAEQLAEALENVGSFHDMSAELIAPELLANLLASTAKDCLVVGSSLPVGVPDGYALVPVEPTEAMLCAGYFTDHAANRAMWKQILDAAPTVKDEQVQCEFCGDTGQIQGTDCGSCAPSLPADGLADVGKFSVQCSVCKESSTLDDRKELSGCCWSCGHEIDLDSHLRAALSAQQSAPELVSVPVELLREALSGALQGPTLHSMIEAKRQLRALLASHGRGEA